MQFARTLVARRCADTRQARQRVLVASLGRRSRLDRARRRREDELDRVAARAALRLDAVELGEALLIFAQPLLEHLQLRLIARHAQLRPLALLTCGRQRKAVEGSGRQRKAVEDSGRGWKPARAAYRQ